MTKLGTDPTDSVACRVALSPHYGTRHLVRPPQPHDVRNLRAREPRDATVLSLALRGTRS